MSGIKSRLRCYRGFHRAAGSPGTEIDRSEVTGLDRVEVYVDGFGSFDMDPRTAASGRLQQLLNFAYQQGRIDKTKEIAAALSIKAEEIA